MKKIIFKLLLFFYICLTSTNSYANKIAYVDIDYILNKSITGQEITNILKKENKISSDNLMKIELGLKIEEKQIISKKNILNDSEFKKLVQDFQEKVNNYNLEKKKSTDKLNEMKINLTKDFIEQINPIFIEFAQKNSISIILKKKDILIGDTNLDVTLEFLNLVNEKIDNE